MDENFEINAELIDALEASAICGVSRSGFYKLDATGKCPRSVKLGRLRKWRRTELMEWIKKGCPPRQKWEMMKK